MSPVSHRRESGWWVLLPGAVLLALLTVLVQDPARWSVVAVPHYGIYFLDLFAVTSAIDLAGLGIDPRLVNPLDPSGRPHVYPEPWLWLKGLGIRTEHADIGGYVLVLVFIALALATLRPRRLGEALLATALICSPPALLALERANNDLVVLVLVLPALVLWNLPRGLFPGCALVAVAGLLKVYPWVAVGALLGPDVPPRQWWWRAAAIGATAVAYGLWALPDLRAVSAVAPSPTGVISYGSADLLVLAGRPLFEARLIGAAASAVVVLALAVLLRSEGASFQAQPEPVQRAWAAAALMLAFCFTANTNFDYRWLIAWPAAAAAFILWRGTATPGLKRIVAAWMVSLLVYGWSSIVVYSADRPALEGLARSPWPDLELAVLIFQDLCSWAFSLLPLALLLAAWVPPLFARLRSADGASPARHPHPA